MNKRIFLSALLLSSLSLNLNAQQPSPPPVPKQGSVTQQPSPQSEPDLDVVRISTNLVQVDAVVTKDGKQITDLKPEDFELFEDGKPQRITSFSYISNVPAASVVPAKVASSSHDKTLPPVVPVTVRPRDVRRTIALVFDDLGMSWESMGHAKQQLRKFVDEQLEPNDLVAIIRTSGEVGSLQQFTTDRRLLSSALDRLRWNPCSRAGMDILPRVTGFPTEVNGIALCSGYTFNGTLRALQFVLKGMRDLPGRKSMVVFSESLPIEQQEPGPINFGANRDDVGSGDSRSGNFTNYSADLEKVAELAIRGSVVIYAVDTRGLQYTGPTAADNFRARTAAELRQMVASTTRARSSLLYQNRAGADLIARQTGGFLTRNSNDFGLKRMMDDQRGYYLIGYRPNEQTFNRRFHHIKVKVRPRGLTVRTREGFYGVSEDEVATRGLGPRDEMNKALMSPFGANQIDVRLATFFANDASAGSLLRTFLYLEARDLVFDDQPDGTHRAAFDLRMIMFGDNGKVVGNEDRTTTLRLSKQGYDRILREGLVYSFDLPVKQYGTFQFRVAVRDNSSSHIGTAGQLIEVPDLRNNRLALSGIMVSDGVMQRSPQVAKPSSTSSALNPNDQVKVADEPSSGPVLRRFHQGTNLVFVYSVYNAQLDRTTQLPQLTTQTRVFRDGKPILTGNPTPLDLSGQRDLQRIATGAQLQLGPDLSPGQYVLQVIVEDRLAKEKRSTATQWIDFEVVR